METIIGDYIETTIEVAASLKPRMMQRRRRLCMDVCACQRKLFSILWMPNPQKTTRPDGNSKIPLRSSHLRLLKTKERNFEHGP